MSSPAGYSPVMPPRSSFVDGGHFAAYLSVLDAADRLQIAGYVPPQARYDYAHWAQRSLEKVTAYLNLSEVDFDSKSRPEYSVNWIMQRARELFAQADAILHQCRPYRPRFSVEPEFYSKSFVLA